ncbi:MAG: hypothetical protein HC921_04505 [Synechococcaceae cyanobacterium SM2_3_1]|nr:hypothetical protein [Synechococcaceae cyanobacterium SM2_3_1]
MAKARQLGCALILAESPEVVQYPKGPLARTTGDPSHASHQAVPHYRSPQAADQAVLAADPDPQGLVRYSPREWSGISLW